MGCPLWGCTESDTTEATAAAAATRAIGHNTLISEPGQGVAKGRTPTSPGRWQRNAVASRGGLGRWVSGWAGTTDGALALPVESSWALWC